jgi:transcriptional regulator with PAS, ATPase and Fis domain
MMELDWSKEFGSAVTVCDVQGIVVYMNAKSEKTYGRSLVKQNLLDCHPEPARTKLMELMKTRTVNSYTIEKNGVKKLIHQAPWHKNGEYAGLVELSIEIPLDMPHFIRAPKKAE